ncbi:unnamed protein product [Chrysodeixis includens]|uniref:Uncharacterized protein n=1 Tax=Chrysodeixis includens TaxID=689277 RepID=A0A9N8Q1Z6_CHRIL|nr:unnamed protein product [Chrysodeixis includens]
MLHEMSRVGSETNPLNVSVSSVPDKGLLEIRRLIKFRNDLKELGANWVMEFSERSKYSRLLRSRKCSCFICARRLFLSNSDRKLVRSSFWKSMLMIWLFDKSNCSKFLIVLKPLLDIKLIPLLLRSSVFRLTRS